LTEGAARIYAFAIESIPDRTPEYRARIAGLEAELKIERLRRKELEAKLAKLLNKRFGASSEKVDPEELQLLLEGLEEVGETPAEEKPAAPAREKRTRKKKMGFPTDLKEEVLEFDLPPEERVCPETGRERRFIRWEESVKYNLVPAHFVKVTIRRAVRAVVSDGELPPSSPVVTAPMPAAFNVIPGCVAGVGLLAHLLVSKYCDHLPFYRLQTMFKRGHKVEVDRDTMCRWSKRCAELLSILYEALRAELVSGNYLKIDETFIKLLDPDRPGKARNSFFWVLHRPGTGVLFHFDPGRGHEVPLALLDCFVGKLQSDAYVVYDTLARKIMGLVLFACWTHARRKFHEAMLSGDPEACWYVAEIQRLYRVERKAREGGFDAEARERLRREESAPVLARIKQRLERDAASPEVLPSSPLGKAVSYLRERWPQFERYAAEGNGEVDIDNNSVENAIRPSAVGKKNWLFIGHPSAGQTSAILYTIIENCRLEGIDPREYLEDVLPRIASHPPGRVAELLPRQWKQAREHAAAAAAEPAASAA
jgi:transposase